MTRYMIVPTFKYKAMEKKIERLEKALDKACEVLEEVYVPYLDSDARKRNETKEQWKKWCLNHE